MKTVLEKVRKNKPRVQKQPKTVATAQVTHPSSKSKKNPLKQGGGESQPSTTLYGAFKSEKKKEGISQLSKKRQKESAEGTNPLLSQDD